METRAPSAFISTSALNSLEVTGRAATHVRGVTDPECVLHAAARDALLAMHAAARTAGIELKVASSFRDFNHQIRIWTAKFNGERVLLDAAGQPLNHADLYENELIDAILTWSALPGASRHHWGSDLDVVDGAVAAGSQPQLLPAEFAPGGRCARLDDWLGSNMERFGFFRPYATYRGGVQPEPWHLSYAPVAVPALAVLSLDVLREALEQARMPGRAAVLGRLPELYERYVLAVDAPP